MALYPKPHSPEWFRSLETFNPTQAAHTRRIIELAGRDDVCSVCGDDPSTELKLVGEVLSTNAVASLRLCDDCRHIRANKYNEQFAPLVADA